MDIEELEILAETGSKGYFGNEKDRGFDFILIYELKEVTIRQLRLFNLEPFEIG